MSVVWLIDALDGVTGRISALRAHRGRRRACVVVRSQVDAIEKNSTTMAGMEKELRASCYFSIGRRWLFTPPSAGPAGGGILCLGWLAGSSTGVGSPLRVGERSGCMRR